MDKQSNSNCDDFMKLSENYYEYRMKNMQNGSKPDTYACDCIFLNNFMTNDMSNDFPLIAREFLLHELPNLEKYQTIQYIDIYADEDGADSVFRKIILNMMMNAYNNGSTYVRDLFLHLHKTYYRKEFNQIKRFDKLSADDLSALSETEANNIATVNKARILTIAKMKGIEISSECDPLYFLLEKVKICDKQTKKFVEDLNYAQKLSEQFVSCVDDINERFDSEEEKVNSYLIPDLFVNSVLISEGAMGRHVLFGRDNKDGDLDNKLANTLGILRDTYGNREISNEELIIYSIIYETLQKLCGYTRDMEKRLNAVMYGSGKDGLKDYSPLFKPFDLSAEVYADNKSETTIEKKDLENSDSAFQYDEKQLLAQIDELQRKIHQLETDYKKDIWNLNTQNRELKEKHILLAENYDLERYELIKLRNDFYASTNDNYCEEELSVETMKAYVSKYTVTIIGGTDAWRNRMKQEFPKWKSIGIEVSGALKSSAITHADFIYFYTDVLTHANYNKYIKAAHKCKVEIGYLNETNIDKNVRRIYKDLKEKKAVEK